MRPTTDPTTDHNACGLSTETREAFTSEGHRKLLEAGIPSLIHIYDKMLPVQKDDQSTGSAHAESSEARVVGGVQSPRHDESRTIDQVAGALSDPSEAAMRDEFEQLGLFEKEGLVGLGLDPQDPLLDLNQPIELVKGEETSLSSAAEAQALRAFSEFYLEGQQNETERVSDETTETSVSELTGSGTLSGSQTHEDRKPRAQPGTHIIATRKKLSVHDVSMGRGGFSNNNKGNKHFHMLKEKLQKTYFAASKQAKTEIAQELVNQVKASGGWFFEKVGNNWVPVTNQVARKKSSQALRTKKKRDTDNA